jgi:hypothetical protein
MLVGRFALARRDVHDDQLAEPRVRPGHQVGQPGLFSRFPEGNSQRVALPRVAVPAHLQPRLLPLVPAQQHPAGFRVHDQRRGGDVEREVAAPRVVDGLGQVPDTAQVGRFGLTLGLVVVKQVGQQRLGGVRIHRMRW